MRKDFRTYNLAVTFYKTCKKLHLPIYLKNQLERASSSIALNLAEGAGRESTKEQKRFFTIAFGSLRECQAILDLISLNSSEAVNQADTLAAHLYCLIRKVR